MGHIKQVRNAGFWRILLTLIACSLILISMDISTGVFGNLLGLRHSVEVANTSGFFQIIGDEVNRSVEDQNIRITITHVAADEYATVLYYEIEDLQKQDIYSFRSVDKGGWLKYSLDISDLLKVWATDKMNISQFMGTELEYSEEPYVLKGKVMLRPIEQETATIPIQIRSLHKVNVSPEHHFLHHLQPTIIEEDAITGVWDIDVPVSKKQTQVHHLSQVVQVDGVEVTLLDVKIAPTVTQLQYYYQDKNPEIAITIDRLEANGKSYWKSNQHFNSDSHYVERQTTRFHTVHFESLYYEQPEEITIHFGTAFRRFASSEIYPIDITQPFPQMFEFMDTTISIHNIVVGNPTTIEVRLEEDTNRSFDSIDIEFQTNIGAYGRSHSQSVIPHEQFYVDRFGERYDWGGYYHPETLFAVRKLDTRYTYYVSALDPQRQVTPTTMIIKSYGQSKFLDEAVTIKLPKIEN